MSRICIFIESLKLGGAEKQSLLLAKVLKNEHRIFVTVLRGECPEERFTRLIKREEIELFVLKGNPLRKLLDFTSLLKEKRVDIIFCYLASNNLYGAIAGKLSGVPYVIGGIRNSVIAPHKLAIQRFLHNNLLYATIFNNYSGKLCLVSQGFKKEKSYVIPNGIELGTPILERTQKPTINLITISRFVPQKDHLTAIKAFHYLVNELLEESLDVRYRIVGYGELEREIRNRIEELNLGDRVSVIINPENKWDYLKDSDIYLSTSLFEGISNSILEAMSYALPIVATNVGDNSFLVEDGVTGYLCEVGHYEQIVKKLRALILNPKLRQEMGVRSYWKLKDNFALDAFKRSYVDFINQLPFVDQNAYASASSWNQRVARELGR